jgi:hypothetical protein
VKIGCFRKPSPLWFDRNAVLLIKNAVAGSGGGVPDASWMLPCGRKRMKIKLPDHDVSKSLTIGGWMLFPKPEDDDLRRLYRSAVKHVRVMRDLKGAGQPIDPASQKYKWTESGNDILAVERLPSLTDESATGSVLIASPKAIVEFHDDYEKFLRKANVDLRFRKGFASGLVLLGCCVFQNSSKRRYGDGKGGAEKAAAELIDLKQSSIRGYFKEFAASAHLWASWLLQVMPLKNLSVDSDVLKVMEQGISLDFMMNVNPDALLSEARSALDFGREEVNTGISLLGGVESIEFDWPKDSNTLIEAIPEALASAFRQFRVESKLDR